jgi:hypothetical protein
MKQHQIAQLEGNLSLSFFKQDDCVVAYSPALDLSTYGSNEKEAEKNFAEALDVFLGEFKDSRELEQVLVSLGWTKNKATAWQPPQVTQRQLPLSKKIFA